MGLAPEHHGELNSYAFQSNTNLRRQRFSELKEEYKDDSIALQQIDKYDPESPYNSHLSRMMNAVNKNEETVQKELAWLKKHYPDV